MSRQILIIEDNLELSELVKMHLRDNGHDVDVAGDGLRGMQLAEQGAYDLVILDLMLPGMDGLDICRRLRTRERYTPVLMLTSRSSELDRVLGLELGADDYVTKPFSIMELMARVKAIMRRFDNLPVPEADSTLRINGLEIDLNRRSVLVDASPVELTAREFDLLHCFASQPGRVFTRAQLLDQVWGYGHDGYEHTVNSHINRLRAKIETDPTHPRFVLTVWGVGYKFSDKLCA